MIVKVPQFPWYGDTEFELSFPDSWEVVVCKMAGQDAPKLGEEGIRAAFLNPIGTPRISQLARGKKEVVILFDDLSRPTKVAELVPFVLEELKAGGIKDENIRFIASVGMHGALRLNDFVKKLGSEIPKRFAVYNHNPYENCTYIGTTSRGTPVSINSEVVSCDLKIAIGSITPHQMAGFGGGAKLVFPGVASAESICHHHSKIGKRTAPTPQNPIGVRMHWGEVDDNEVRLDIEESARMAGLDVIVNAVINMQRDAVGLFVGDLIAAHRAGVKLARKLYATEVPKNPDVVIANAYCKANEGILVVGPGNGLLKKEGGDLVIICNVPEGQICHYLSRSFGKGVGGKLWGRRTCLLPRTKRLIVLGPYIDKVGIDWLGPPELTTIADSWTEVIDLLKKNYGDTARVAVVPDATLQHFPALWENHS